MPEFFTIKPEPLKNETPEEHVVRVELLLGKTLRIGVLAAATVLAAGVILFFARERHDVSYSQALGRHEAITALTPRMLWNGLKDGSARSIILLGILLLILTPIVRVAMTLLLFFKTRDWILFACAGFVLAILLLGLLGLGV
jgi:uncharacterized membrane protein